jgi:four helix bundle protein
MRDAQASGMSGARHFTELIVWQLGDQHRIEVFKLTSQTRLRTDLKLRSQIDDAADSVCRNIAEGFGCQSHREFARFVRIARRSLNEVQDGFRSAVVKQYFTEADLVPARRLQRRLYAALAAFLRYLDGDSSAKR